MMSKEDNNVDIENVDVENVANEIIANENVVNENVVNNKQNNRKIILMIAISLLLVGVIAYFVVPPVLKLISGDSSGDSSGKSALSAISDSPHLTAIPGDATFVVAIEIKQLLMKSGLININNFNIIKDLRSEFRNNSEGQAVMNMIDDLSKNPTDLGLGIDKMFFFGKSDRNGDFWGGLTLEVVNESKLEANIKKIGISSRDIENRSGYKIIRSGGPIIAWNNKVLFIGEGINNLDDFFKRTNNKSIASNENFIEFYNRKYDIGLWVTKFSDFFDIMRISRSERREAEAVLGDLVDTQMHSYLIFNNGELKVSFVMSPEKKMKEYSRKYPIAKKSFDNNLLKAFPEKSFMATKLALNVPAILNLVKSVMKEHELGFMFDMVMSDRTTKTVVDGLKGDILLSIYDINDEVPQAGLAFSVSNKEVFDIMRGLTEDFLGMNWERRGDSFATYDLDIPIFTAFKNNVVFITNDRNAISTFTDKGYSQSLSPSLFNNNNFSEAYVNLDINSYPREVKELIRSFAGQQYDNELWRYEYYGWDYQSPPVDNTEEIYDIVIKFIELYKDVTFSVSSDYETIISLKMKDSRKNVLEQIITYFDDMYGKHRDILMNW